ncbi:MAG: hypothetical protein IJQ93_04375 [Bacteroidales bacterium]|nr:hypothetical protein [Bacteroidales bacterium]
MKKQILFVISLIIILLGGVSPLRAETPAKPVYYVEVYESSLMGAKSVCINYGVNAPFGKSYKITDGDGSPIDFENALGALNYLGHQGWELVSVYERDMKSAGRRTFYLLRLDGAKYGPNQITEAIDAMLGMDQ